MSSANEQPTTSKRHQISDGTELNVWPVDCLGYKPNQKYQLIDLNDDCLIHLFRYLPLKHLNAIGATCQQFHDLVAINVYKYTDSLKRFDIEAFGRRYPDTDLEYKLDCIKGYLGKYGHFIEHIDFDKNLLIKGENSIFTYIANSCSKALKSLKTRNVNLISETISNDRFMFANLTKLDIDNRLSWSEVIPLCANLEELSLFIAIDTRKIQLNFPGTFPKLKKFSLKTGFYQIKIPFFGVQFNRALDLFLQKHLHLTSLALTLPGLTGVTNIGCLTNLKELYLEISLSWNLQSIFGLSKLERIEIGNATAANYPQFLRQSASAQTLKHLKYYSGVIDEEFIDVLSRFRHLRYLSLSFAFNAWNVPNVPDDVWTKLQQLKELIGLSFYYVEPEIVAKFGKYLANTNRSLQNFSYHGTLNNVIVATMVRFGSLQKLELRGCSIIYGESAFRWKPFHQIPQLKEFILDSSAYSWSSGILPHLLNNLGSFNTLERMEISVARQDAEYIEAIVKFVNLKELKFGLPPDRLSSEKLLDLGRLSHIRKFHFVMKEWGRNVAKTILVLVEKWKSLEYFRFDIVESTADADREFLQNKLTEILKARDNSHQLNISVGSQFVEISSPK